MKLPCTHSPALLGDGLQRPLCEMANQDDLSKFGDAGWELVEASPGLGAQMKPACLCKGPLCFSLRSREVVSLQKPREFSVSLWS